MGFFYSTAPKYHLNHVATKYPFMTCIVRVDTESHWQGIVASVLNKCDGVHSFRMDQKGVVEISGTVDPQLLLKKLGRAGRYVELCWFQFGECSSNLFMPTNPGGGSTYYPDGRSLHGSNLPRPSINIQNHVFYDDNNQSGYSHGGNQIQHHRGGDEDISCCTVM